MIHCSKELEVWEWWKKVRKARALGFFLRFFLLSGRSTKSLFLPVIINEHELTWRHSAQDLHILFCIISCLNQINWQWVYSAGLVRYSVLVIIGKHISLLKSHTPSRKLSKSLCSSVYQGCLWDVHHSAALRSTHSITPWAQRGHWKPGWSFQGWSLVFRSPLSASHSPQTCHLTGLHESWAQDSVFSPWESNCIPLRPLSYCP